MFFRTRCLTTTKRLLLCCVYLAGHVRRYVFDTAVPRETVRNTAYSKPRGVTQIIAYSTPHRRTLKWYIKLASELLLNTSISNAMILYKQARKTKIKVSDSRMALAMHLTQCHSPEQWNILIRQRLRHEMQKKEGQAYLARKFCRECYKKC